jgi:hypothetical protein
MAFPESCVAMCHSALLGCYVCTVLCVISRLFPVRNIGSEAPPIARHSLTNEKAQKRGDVPTENALQSQNSCSATQVKRVGSKFCFMMVVNLSCRPTCVWGTQVGCPVWGSWQTPNTHNLGMIRPPYLCNPTPTSHY